MSGILCSQHQRELYEDMRDGEPMNRPLCPEPGLSARAQVSRPSPHSYRIPQIVA